MRRTRTSLLRLALLIGSLFLVLALAEAALRAMGSAAPDAEAWRTGGFHQPDAELIYAMKPNVHHRRVTDEFDELVVTNSLGLRGQEVGPKAAGQRRILVLGDSMTFGHGVGGAESYPAQLEALFREAGEAVEIVNAGVKGYGTDQSFKLFGLRLRGLDPDLVILAYYENDLWDNVWRPLYDIEGERLVELDARRNPLYRLARYRQAVPGPLRGLRLTGVALDALAHGPGGDPRIPDGEEAQLAWSRRKTLLEIAALAEMGEADGFRVMVLGVPYARDPVDRYAWLRRSLRGQLPVAEPGREPAWRADEAELFFGTDPHLTAAGHLRLAEALHGFLSQRRGRLLPGG